VHTACHIPRKRFLHDLVHELSVVREQADLVLLLHGEPLGHVLDGLMLEAVYTYVEGCVAEVALVREVDAMLLEVTQEGLATVEGLPALPALGDLVDVVVVSLRVHVVQFFRGDAVEVWRRPRALPRQEGRRNGTVERYLMGGTWCAGVSREELESESLRLGLLLVCTVVVVVISVFILVSDIYPNIAILVIDNYLEQDNLSNLDLYYLVILKYI